MLHELTMIVLSTVFSRMVRQNGRVLTKLVVQILPPYQKRLINVGYDTMNFSMQFLKNQA